MFLLVKVLVYFGWVGVIGLSTLAAIVIAKRIFEKNVISYEDAHIEVKGKLNIVAIEKENSVIDEICDFCDVENGYCDSLLNDRMMLQDLYDEFVEVSKERNDGNYAFPRDILNYRLNDPEARSKLLENLTTYLILRRETNRNLLQYRRAT